MEGYLYFKKLRENTGKSIRQFASECEISPRSLTYYENGTKSLTGLPVSKCITIFQKIDQDIPAFFNRYYSFQEDVREKMTKYNEDIDLEYDVLLQKVSNRIAQIRCRKQIEENRLHDIEEMFKQSFETMKVEVENGVLSREQYSKFIQPILYRIRLGNETLDFDIPFDCVLDKLYQSNYTLKDLADFCNISQQHLGGCKRGQYDIMQMRIESVLKICYTLNLNFYEVFYSKIKGEDRKITRGHGGI